MSAAKSKTFDASRRATEARAKQAKAEDKRREAEVDKKAEAIRFRTMQFFDELTTELDADIRQSAREQLIVTLELEEGQ